MKQTTYTNFNPNKMAVSLMVRLLMNLFSIALTYIDESNPFQLRRQALKIGQTLPKNQICSNIKSDWLSKAVHKMDTAIHFLVVQNIHINRHFYINNHFFIWTQISNLNKQYHGIFSLQNITEAEKIFFQTSSKRRLSNFINPTLKNSYNIIRLGLLANRPPNFCFLDLPQKIQIFFDNKFKGPKQGLLKLK
jgi:hypothetical protein